MMTKQGKDIDYKELIKKHTDNRIACSICGYSIPKELERYRFEKHGYQSSAVNTVCGVCLIQLAKLVDKKVVRKVMEARFVEQL